MKYFSPTCSLNMSGKSTCTDLKRVGSGGPKFSSCGFFQEKKTRNEDDKYLRKRHIRLKDVFAISFFFFFFFFGGGGVK